MKEEILSILTEEWKSTARINFEVQGNYYETYNLLVELNEKFQCDRMRKGKLGHINLWRKPLLPDKKQIIEHGRLMASTA